MTKTADSFLTDLKARVTLPENQALLDDTALLKFASQVTNIHMVPNIISVNEDYFTTIADIACVVDQQLYEIPSRAIGNSLADVKYRTSATIVSDLSLIQPEDEHQWRSYKGVPVGFNLRGDLLYLVGSPQNANHVIEVWYDRRPNTPTKLANCAAVDSVAGDVVTVESVPTGWTTGTKVDFIRNGGMGRVLAEEKAIQSISNLEITFAASVVPATAPSALAAADYLAPTGTSPIFQIPDELIELLETWTAKRCMGAIGDFEAKKDLSYDEKQELENALKLISPRVRGETRKIVNRNGLLGGRRGHGKGYYG